MADLRRGLTAAQATPSAGSGTGKPQPQKKQDPPRPWWWHFTPAGIVNDVKALQAQTRRRNDRWRYVGGVPGVAGINHLYQAPSGALGPSLTQRDIVRGAAQPVINLGLNSLNVGQRLTNGNKPADPRQTPQGQILSGLEKGLDKAVGLPPKETGNPDDLVWQNLSTDATAAALAGAFGLAVIPQAAFTAGAFKALSPVVQQGLRWTAGIGIESFGSTLMTDNTQGNPSNLTGGPGAITPEDDMASSMVKSLLPNAGAELTLGLGALGLGKTFQNVSRRLRDGRRLGEVQGSRDWTVEQGIQTAGEDGYSFNQPPEQPKAEAPAATEATPAPAAAETAAPKTRAEAEAELGIAPEPIDPTLPEVDVLVQGLDRLDDSRLQAAAGGGEGPVLPVVEQQLTEQTAGLKLQEGLKLEELSARTDNMIEPLTPYSEQWAQLDFNTLVSLAAPENNPRLFNQVHEMTGREWPEFTRKDVLDGLSFMEAEGMALMPSRIPKAASGDVKFEPYADPVRRASVLGEANGGRGLLRIKEEDWKAAFDRAGGVPDFLALVGKADWEKLQQGIEVPDAEAKIRSFVFPEAEASAVTPEVSPTQAVTEEIKLAPADRDALKKQIVENAIANGEVRPSATPIPDLPDGPTDLKNPAALLQDELRLADHYGTQEVIKQHVELQAQRAAIGYDAMPLDEKKANGMLDTWKNPAEASLDEKAAYLAFKRQEAEAAGDTTLAREFRNAELRLEKQRNNPDSVASIVDEEVTFVLGERRINDKNYMAYKEVVSDAIKRIAGEDVKFEITDDILRIMNPDEHGGGNKMVGVAGEYNFAKDLVSVYGFRKRSPADLVTAAYHESWHRIQYTFLNTKEMEILDSVFGKARMKQFNGELSTRTKATMELQAEAFELYSEIRAGTGNRPADELKRQMWIDRLDEQFPKKNGESWRGTLTERVTTALFQGYDRILGFMEKVNNYARGRGFRGIDDLFEQAFSGELARERSTVRAMELLNLEKDARQKKIVEWRTDNQKALADIDQGVASIDAQINALKAQAISGGC